MTQAAVTVGQRYVSDTEPELGLGVVLQTGGNTVDIGFPAARERRTYSLKEAPLSRIRYAEGERVKHQDGQKLTIQAVTEQGGCLLYDTLTAEGEARSVPEFELDSFVRFSRPRERLFAGQVDRKNHFDLRYLSQGYHRRTISSPVFGLTGPRVSLMPHQMYVAQQVADRHAPRVLLADEVGLGKTIEAGLVTHRQLMTGRAERVLIVVPEALTHQWLVEMHRRFNLPFTLLDEERCRDLEGRDDEDDLLDIPLDDDELLERADAEPDNPFESAQRVICSLDFIAGDEQRLAQAREAGWDLLLVDEAHHLRWHPEQPSAEYRAIETLAETTPGLLLLTATPEQLGLESHFARLRLLDPDRYHDFEAFQQEQADYRPLSDLVGELMQIRPADPDTTGALDDGLKKRLAEWLGQETVANADRDAQAHSQAAVIDELVTALLDRHGTGRVLLRNTRQAVQGFPERHYHAHPIPLDSGAAGELADRPLDDQLHPERFWQGEQDWWLADPRVGWLKDFVKARRGQKILLICHSGDTAQSLELYLRLKHGIASAVFHEDMTLLERDRAAAYFADPEEGAQLLIASEIGSEGRNFQFAQDLVLFDLPLDPDLLEQRIGRLDRIGQPGAVHIHLPHYQTEGPTTATERLARWYHEGLNAFEHTCAIGHTAFERFGEVLESALTGTEELDPLIQQTREFADKLNAELEAGRDRLLELNACRPDRAEALMHQLRESDADTALPEFLRRVLDCFNVEYERESESVWIIHPGEHMRVDPFPGLPDGGLTITFDRDEALTREDISFMSWEHPLVQGALELILDTEFGNTAVATLKLPPLKPGTLMVEAVFTLQCTGPRWLQLERYLRDPVMRVLLDTNGKDFGAALTPDKLGKVLQKVPRASAQELVRHSRPQIAELLDSAEERVDTDTRARIDEAVARAHEQLDPELDRLQALAQVNPNIRQSEIDAMQRTLDESVAHLRKASLQLDAVRVIVAV